MNGAGITQQDWEQLVDQHLKRANDEREMTGMVDLDTVIELMKAVTNWRQHVAEEKLCVEHNEMWDELREGVYNAAINAKFHARTVDDTTTDLMDRLRQKFELRRKK